MDALKQTFWIAICFIILCTMLALIKTIIEPAEYDPPVTYKEYRGY